MLPVLQIPRSHDDSGPVSAGSRRLAAIAFVDIVGYSALMAQDEARTHDWWMRVLAEVIRPTSHQHRGRIIKSTGDGILAEFPSALDAVDWARDVQRLLQQDRQQGDPDASGASLRIAVHIGDVITTEDDIYGDGVNVAARLQDHGPPGGVIMSEAVHDLVRGSISGAATDLGLLYLKNLPTPVRAYGLDPEVPGAGGAKPVHTRHSGLPSIAVLPLRNLSASPEDNYFADGIVEDIIVSLSGLRELLVIARSSSVTVGRRQTDPGDIGRALGVRYVMSGSVRRSTRMVRVSAQLHDVSTGASLWAENTEQPVGELFDLQDMIVRRIVAGIAPHVRSAELRNALRKHPEKFTAYENTLRALSFINSLDKGTFEKALHHLNRAMSEDPNFAMATAWAARWHSLLVGQGWSKDRLDDSRKAAELAARAIGLDGQNAIALATYGHVMSFLFHDYDSGLVYFDRALAACPNSALAWLLSSGTLSHVGRGDQAVRHAEHALRLSPYDDCLYVYYMFFGMAHYSNGSIEEAVKWGRMSFTANPNYTANLRIMSAALAAAGRLDEARAGAQRLLMLEPDFTLERYERSVQPFRNPDFKAAYIEHLRLAGLPA